ncbi:MAG: hypothetical protein CXX81_03100 [Methanobacteriota archaeon]|nr:MAG: hypothetical protein CXX81_16200 [Euryarchaeota archaeon]PXY79307.1 MAG: hypothetical protein CXX81_03100 [Euryarchaeota archaeon]
MVKFLQKKMAPVEPPEGDPTKTVFALLVFLLEQLFSVQLTIWLLSPATVWPPFVTEIPTSQPCALQISAVPSLRKMYSPGSHALSLLPAAWLIVQSSPAVTLHV